MAISRVDTTSVANQSVLTHTAPTPVGVAAGDLLIVATSASLATLPVWTASSYTGWTIAEDLSESSMLTRILYRIADGTSADNPPAVATNASAHRVSQAGAYRGVDTASPFIAEAGTVHVSTTAATAHAAPAISNTDAAAWAVFLGAARQVATPLTWTPPTGLVEQEDQDTALATTNNTAATWADSNGATLATGSITYTGTTSATTAQANVWAAFLKPAATGGGTNLDKLRLGASVVGLRVGSATPSAVYLGATKVWP